MERRVAVLVAVLAVLVASVTATVAVTDDDRNWFGHREGMMSSLWDDRADGPGEWQQPGWREPGGPGPGWMMRGTMRGVRVGSEYAYLAEMVVHHEEAVAAARQLQRSQTAQMREFGEAIVASQSIQIDQMRQWLDDWYPSRSGRVDYQPMMRDLTGLSGDRLDRVFLQDMIGHHMAAVMMSQQLLMRGVADHEQVEVLAQTIRDEQHAEIFQMQQRPAGVVRSRLGRRHVGRGAPGHARDDWAPDDAVADADTGAVSWPLDVPAPLLETRMDRVDNQGRPRPCRPGRSGRSGH